MSIPIPKHYLSANDRCEEACLATQSSSYMQGFGPTPNGAISITLHLMMDADCEHCAPHRTAMGDRKLEYAYSMVARIVEAAKAVGKAS